MKKVLLSQEKIDEIQKIHNNGIFWNNLPKEVGVSLKVLNNHLSEGKLLKIKHKKVWTEKDKIRISNSRKNYLKNNPDKHPWKNNNKFLSKPCELFKKKLEKLNILFSPEFTDPEWNRFYSIDVAFPNHKIGIEINGNQHYNNDGTLKEYYNEKNDFLISNGWKIYDIHYSIVYNENIMNNLICDIKQFSLSQEEYDKFLNYYVKNKKKYICVTCGIEISRDSKSGKCLKCHNIDKRKVQRPSIEQLLNDIKLIGYRGTGNKYGVSDNAIRKWLK